MSDDPAVKAIDLYNQGAKILLSKPTDAESQQLAYRFFASAVDCDPNLVEGWFAIGNANSDLGLWDAAVAAWKRGAELSPHDGRFACNIGHRLYWLGKIEAAKRATEAAIKLEIDSGYGYTNLSLIESVLGNMPKAISAGRKGFELSPEPTTEMGLAFALMFAGQYAEGLKHFEARFPYKLPQYLEYPYPKWEGEDITGKTLFLMSEQGIGDTLSFARFIPMVAARAGRVRLHIQPELLRTFSAMFAHLFNVEIIPLPAPFGEADVWTSMTSLPVVLGLTDKEIVAAPMPGIPDFPAAMMWKRADRKLHVGVSWQGAKANEVDRWRSFPCELLFPLANVPGVLLYSLQVGEGSQDMHMKGAAGFIRDLSPYLRDVGDTLTVMRGLDLVICCESSVRHMAGAIGKECWVPYSYCGGDWRCGRNQKHPLWDPNTTLFRQGTDQTWGPVFKRIVAGLKARARSDRRAA